MKHIYLFLLTLCIFSYAKSQETEVVNLNTVVITATRTDGHLYDVPQRIDLITKTNIESMPSLTTDNFLMLVPGINVSRGASIFGSGNISMRGMGNEAGRMLIMIDGVPLNKSDGGSVNWNALSPSDINQIEVLKGPGSTTHGGNAMGGVVNIVTPTPSKPFQGFISQSIGSFATLQSRVMLGGLKNKIYWSAGGSYRTSDGYITTPADEIDEYSVAAFLDEYNFSAKAGYKFTNNQKIEASGNYYSGQRGTGSDFIGYGFENENLASNKGAFNLYEVLSGRVAYTADFDKARSLKITLYSQRENYNNIRESLKDSTISRYDVLSVRDDAGFLSGYTFSPAKYHKVSTGIDIRYGAVDGADNYVTSTDRVINAGKMTLSGIYIQDEINIKETPFSLLAGLRYDMARFYDGAFIVENPTKETEFLGDFSGELASADFSALSPRLSVQYFKPQTIRLYAGYSKGYRAPVLDDMCRTGRISGGMKIANPDLKPEFLDNLEAGTDIFINERFSVSSSLFYSIGKDYHANISTGDSIVLNRKMRPIMKKSNIGEVELYGAEFGLKMNLLKNVSWQIAYSHIITNIIEFGSDETSNELSGKELVYQPTDIFNTSAVWKNKFLNASVNLNYKGAQWINDVNTEKIDNYYFIDLQLYRRIYKELHASLMVHNLLNNDFVDSRNLIAPGRMVFLELKYNL
jgi:outer membrane receptor protein involved in Fe transport